MKLTVVIRRIGPYHRARLRALADHAPGTVGAIEVVARDEIYAWDRIGDIPGLLQTTLFDDESQAQSSRKLWSKMHRVLDAWNPEVIALPGWSDPAALAALAWCHRRGRASVLMSDSTRWDAARSRWRELIKKYIVKSTGAGFCAGEPHRQYLMSLGMPGDRIYAGYDVVDNDHFGRISAAARADKVGIAARLDLPSRYLLSVSRWVEKKNIPRLLKGYALYRSIAGAGVIPLVLVGSGPLEREIRETIETLKLTDLVHLKPFAQYEELPLYYGLADGLILASNVEQWGLVVNEAMACAIPVLVSRRCGAAADLITAGQTGWVFDPDDPADIAAAIHSFSLLATTERSQIGANAKCRISQWSPRHHAYSLFLAAEAAKKHRRRSVGAYVALKLVSLATSRAAAAAERIESAGERQVG